MSPEKREAEIKRAQEAADADSALVKGFEIIVATRMSVPLFAYPSATGVAFTRLTFPFLAKQASIDKRLSEPPAELGAAQARKGHAP